MNEAMLHEAYQADDYFGTPFREGVYDDLSQWWMIYKENNVYEHDDFLVIGSPGVDQVEWGYRKGEKGIWMYEPVKQELRFLSRSLIELVEGWQSGTISV